MLHGFFFKFCTFIIFLGVGFIHDAIYENLKHRPKSNRRFILHTGTPPQL